MQLPTAPRSAKAKSSERKENKECIAWTGKK